MIQDETIGIDHINIALIYGVLNKSIKVIKINIYCDCNSL